MQTQWRELVAGDLFANTGRKGIWALLSALLYHPGFSTAFYFRLAVKLRQRGYLRIANILWRNNVARTACHLHLDSEIEEGLILPHPTGIVVGSGVKIGRSATVYQHVTLGRNLRDENYPIIGDHVIIFPGAIIVGSIRVGNYAVIGAGSIVNLDVPDHGVVAGNPARLLRINAMPR